MKGSLGIIKNASDYAMHNFLILIAGMLVLIVSFVIATELKLFLLEKTNMKEGNAEIVASLAMLPIPAMVVALITLMS